MSGSPAVRVLVLTAALLVAACDGDDDRPLAYLVLGDSLGAGIGADAPEESGYAPVLHRYLAEGGGAPPFLNLAWPGLTTRAMLDRGHVDDAVSALEAGVDGAPVGLVTLTIGGNDGARLFTPCEDGPTAACRAAAVEVLDAFQANFDAILGRLVQAAPDEARIAVMTFYNPLLHPGCRFHEQVAIADEVLEGGERLDLGPSLNDRVRETAARHGVLVVETYGALEAEHLRDDCLHPNDGGHRILAELFTGALAEAAR